MGKLNFRVVIFALAFLFGVVFSIPSLTQSESGKKITLGLDLQGGLHMLLGIKTEEAIKSYIKSLASTAKFTLDKKDIVIDDIVLSSESVSFAVLDEDEVQNAHKLLQETLKEEKVTAVKNMITITLPEVEIKKVTQKAISQAVETIRNRLNQFGLAEPTVAKQGKDKILVEVPGIKTEEDKNRIKKLIAKTAHLQLMAVDEGRTARASVISEAEAKKYGDVVMEDVKNPNDKYLLRAIPILDGSMLTDAKSVYDKNGQPMITFELNGEGAKIFANFTEKAAPSRARLAIVLDKKVYSAPHINERIGGGRGQITGGFTINEANDVAIALRSGALLAPVYVMEERSVGPSLGKDSIIASSIALMSGFILVFLFMMLYYGMAGVIADIALVANLFLLIAIMSLFGATLTLPGMAGIVLTVGMAVDANVIINERIRELLREGKSVAKAIEDGYANAFTAIWDANVTTLIASTLLFFYGTGAIKGFAVTMTIGILASMLTAILGTHGIYQMILPKIKKEKLGFWFGIKGVK
ncbi:MAG TPA: protein translocase subunit SecD [Nitratifractor sp.]|nr:protein translocase subunit SecD [Nitratifractor sp.]HHD74755.1 protein translocase subunit SecD [Nitratifractor sp.]